MTYDDCDHDHETPAGAERCARRLAADDRDVCGCYCHRPRQLGPSTLDAGELGWWPVLGAQPDELRQGDRVSFPGDELGDIVAAVERETCKAWPCRIGYVTTDGRRLTIGRMAHGFRLDRWGTSATLGQDVR